VEVCRLTGLPPLDRLTALLARLGCHVPPAPHALPAAAAPARRDGEGEGGEAWEGRRGGAAGVIGGGGGGGGACGPWVSVLRSCCHGLR
jgi:uncharacterized membrane protein YgcG